MPSSALPRSSGKPICGHRLSSAKTPKVEERVLEHRGRLDGRMVLEASAEQCQTKWAQIPDYAYQRNSSRGRRHITLIVSGHVQNCNDRWWASK
jgi:hypothetical protein